MNKRLIKKTLFLVASIILSSSTSTVFAKPITVVQYKKTVITVGKKKMLKISNVKGKVKWSTSNKKIAIVSSKGVVKGIKAGTTNINAKTGNKKYVYKVTVKKDPEAERKKYLEMLDTLGATDWQGFESFSKLGMSKSSVYNVKAAAAKYCDAQQMPEMSICSVEKVKKRKKGYSYVLTMYWTNSGYFEIYKTTCDKKANYIKIK